MEYQVPQFIEVESKIVGPFTLRQFIYIAGGVGLCFVLIHFLPFFIGILLCLPVAGFAGALAFYKVNNKPFINIVEAAVRFYTSSKLFLWRKEAPKPAPKAPEPKAAPKPAPSLLEQQHQARLTQDRLHELAWSLDVKDRPDALSSRA